MSTVALVAQDICAANHWGMSDASSRRGKVTPENRHESARLKALWNGYKADGGKSQAEFGHEYGIGSQSAVGNMLNGEQAISLKAA